eukprot:2001407-Pyramimonas_sp.AAC.1
MRKHRAKAPPRGNNGNASGARSLAAHTDQLAASVAGRLGDAGARGRRRANLHPAAAVPSAAVGRGRR